MYVIYGVKIENDFTQLKEIENSEMGMPSPSTNWVKLSGG